MCEQGRVDDVDAAQDRGAQAGADQAAGQGGAGPARHHAGLHGGAVQVQQVRVEGRHPEVPAVDGRVRLLLIDALTRPGRRASAHTPILNNRVS